uniref:Pentatricopeptide repeat-containing protein At2g01510 family n=1 Tax=Cajanus cajan TaxID=3821 RepID=A0A151RHL0_CAJCA|nr:Putative pentatricopeptide repeat-containing protein At2g01510 family [Cajanus cajan]
MPHKNTISTNTMIMGYINSGNLSTARSMFDSMLHRTVVTWKMLIGGYAQNNQFCEAFGLFVEMCRHGTVPNHVTLATLLSGFTGFESDNEVGQVHAQVVKSGYDSTLMICNSLLDSYCKMRNLGLAYHLFKQMLEKDTVTFSALLTGYSKEGFNHDAINLFFKMQDLGLRPTEFTFRAVLTATIQLDDIEFGQQVHSFLVKCNFVWNVFVATALLDFYSKHDRVVEASKLFDEMPEVDGISYNVLVTCYAWNGRVEESLELFRELQYTRFDRRQFPFPTLLSIAANALSLEIGRQIHSQTLVTNAISDSLVGNVVVDMYAKCGKFGEAKRIFADLPHQSLVSWTALISGYVQKGLHEDGLKLFIEMQIAKICANSATYANILRASYAQNGDGDHALRSFEQMVNSVYKLVPIREHYASMVDMLCRSGRFDEAEKLMALMPFEADEVMWTSVLNSCRIHKNQELAKKVADKLFNMEVLRNVAPYPSMSNIYAAIGEWENVRKVKKAMRERGVRKVPGYSWVEIKQKTHVFSANDKSHPQMKEITRKLDELEEKMEKQGYKPDSCCALHDVDEEVKLESLKYHSERIAIAFALISTLEGSPILVLKNLRACNNCYAAIKVISKIVNWEITVRDSRRFRHFRDGSCSCKDYW